MKKIGRVSSALGLIFLGIWKITDGINSELANSLFQWWPMFIACVGAEILIFLHSNKEGEKMRISGLVVIVLVVFLGINAAQAAHSFVGDVLHDKEINYFFNERTKDIHVDKTLDLAGKELYLKARDCNLNIKKSPDNNARLVGELRIREGDPRNTWDIKTFPDQDRILIDIHDEKLQGFEGDLYIPEDCKLRFEFKDFNIKSEGVTMSSFAIDGKDGNMNLSNVKNVSIKMKDGQVDLAGNSENVDCRLLDGKVTMAGSIGNLQLAMKDGLINIHNAAENKAEINLKDGKVLYQTKNQDVNVRMRLKDGTCTVNGREVGNSNMSERFGSGKSNINIGVNDGKISFSNQE